MANNRQTGYFEAGLYLTLLGIAFLFPVLMTGPSGEKNWNWIVGGWLHLIPFLGVFLVNNYLLAPKLLLKEKYGKYIITCILLVAVVIVADKALLSKEKMKQPPFNKEMAVQGNPPQENMSCPPGEGISRPSREAPFHRPPGFNFGAIIICFLLIGFNSGIKIFVRWNEERNSQMEKEKQHLTTELAYLKHQISPHFFMNTLNNIHALVDIDGERAKEAIIKLSRLMRYMLYESDVEKTSFTKEIEFLESYIELMRLRYDEKQLKIQLQYPERTDAISVPSFLLISFVENAFKHGIDLTKQSLINIDFQLINDRLTMKIRNENPSVSTASSMDESSGIGLENVKKRLQLIYKEDYTLSVVENKNWYEVTLSIPV